MTTNRDSRRSPLDGGTLLEISNAMSAFMRECYGKGPKRARTYSVDNYLLVVLEGGLTEAEETLLSHGESGLVRAFRARFQEVTSFRAVETVERLSGRRVLDYVSQLLLETVTTVKVFILAEPLSSCEPGGASAGGPGGIV